MVQVSEQSVQYALLATAMDKNVVQIQQFLSDISATQGKDGLDDGFKKRSGKLRRIQCCRSGAIRQTLR
jgi:predicted adenine nucleotide alpha hydrolase (AANH) superfamily ATPase